MSNIKGREEEWVWGCVQMDFFRMKILYFFNLASQIYKKGHLSLIKCASILTINFNLIPTSTQPSFSIKVYVWNVKNFLIKLKPIISFFPCSILLFNWVDWCLQQRVGRAGGLRCLKRRIKGSDMNSFRLMRKIFLFFTRHTNNILDAFET